MGLLFPALLGFVSVSCQGCNRTTCEEILTRRWLMSKIRYSSE